LAHLIGLGIDLVEVARMRRALGRTTSFEARVFTRGEASDARRRSDPAEGFAARFAAKEAVLKAMGLGLWEVPLVDIELSRVDGGVPRIVLHAAAASAATARGIDTWEVSISHDGGIAAAVAAALRA